MQAYSVWIRAPCWLLSQYFLSCQCGLLYVHGHREDDLPEHCVWREGIVSSSLSFVQAVSLTARCSLQPALELAISKAACCPLLVHCDEEGLGCSCLPSDQCLGDAGPVVWPGNLQCLMVRSSQVKIAVDVGSKKAMLPSETCHLA